MFSETIINRAKVHAMTEYPKEAVGYVVNGMYVAQTNISEDPLNNFEVDPKAWVNYSKMGKIQGVIHSHPIRYGENGTRQVVDYPNAVDMFCQIRTAVPWGIIVCDGEWADAPFFWGGDTPIPPLTGTKRFFRHGVTDCYSLIRDYYRLKLEILLPDYPRNWLWWEEKDEDGKQHDLYSKFFADAGFYKVNPLELKPNDVFLAQLPKSEVVCHGGIYLGGPGDMILHHLSGTEPTDRSRLAVEEPGIRYQKYVVHWIRHKRVNQT